MATARNFEPGAQDRLPGRTAGLRPANRGCAYDEEARRTAGGLAIRRRRSVANAAAPLGITPLPVTHIERKVEYKGSTATDFTNSDTWGRLADEVRATVRNLMTTMGPDEQRTNPEIVQAADLILADRNRPAVVNALYRLRASRKDYGTFDLGDHQHLLLLVYELRRSLDSSALSARIGVDPNQVKPDADYQSKTRAAVQDEVVDFEKVDRERDQAQKAHFQKSPRPGLTFELAILGTGASAAYYLESNKSKVDPLKSIVIGEMQPWAGQRGLVGAANERMRINHTMDLISPNRSEVGLGDQQLVPREDFSNVVRAEIRSHVRMIWDARVRSVRLVEGNGATFYAIDAEGYGLCYAQHVVAALGSGVHLEPDNKAATNLALPGPVPRVMNLDEFQAHAANIPNTGPRVDIFVSGGNAAIDAVTRILREIRAGKNFHLIWVQGNRGAQFLKGTDNEETQAALHGYNDAYAGRTGAVTVVGNRVNVTVTPVNQPVRNVQADYYVHGQGQDATSTVDLFVDRPDQRAGFVANLQPVADPNQNFDVGAISGLQTPPPATPTLPYDASPSLMFIGATASKLAAANVGPPNATFPGKNNPGIDANIPHLPQNVVSQEQLAPIRSAQESQSGYIPSYIGQDANFSVDNRTAIRIHIALKYPRIPPAEADICAAVIVGQRQPNAALIAAHPLLVGPIPNPTGTTVRETSVTFSNAVKQWLTDVENRAR